MTPTSDTPSTARGRPRRLRRLAVTTSVATGQALAPTAAVAQPVPSTEGEPTTFIDPADPCLPNAEAPPAPAEDRDEIDPVHVDNVDCAYALGIAVGTMDGDYDPEAGTRRDQLASFIVRALTAAGYDLPAPEDQGFTDIEGNTHEDEINQLAQIGVTEGVTETTYVPRQVVTRDQMASFILQAAEYGYDDIIDGVGQLEAQLGPYFSDVPEGNVHKDNIEAAFEIVGLTTGVTTDAFQPDQITQRQQMATFLIRLVDMTLMPDAAPGANATTPEQVAAIADDVLVQLDGARAE